MESLLLLPLSFVTYVSVETIPSNNKKLERIDKFMNNMNDGSYLKIKSHFPLLSNDTLISRSLILSRQTNLIEQLFTDEKLRQNWNIEDSREWINPNMIFLNKKPIIDKDTLINWTISYVVDEPIENLGFTSSKYIKVFKQVLHSSKNQYAFIKNLDSENVYVECIGDENFVNNHIITKHFKFSFGSYILGFVGAFVGIGGSLCVTYSLTNKFINLLE